MAATPFLRWIEESRERLAGLFRHRTRHGIGGVLHRRSGWNPSVVGILGEMPMTADLVGRFQVMTGVWQLDLTGA